MLWRKLTSCKSCSKKNTNRYNPIGRERHRSDLGFLCFSSATLRVVPPRVVLVGIAAAPDHSSSPARRFSSLFLQFQCLFWDSEAAATSRPRIRSSPLYPRSNGVLSTAEGKLSCLSGRSCLFFLVIITVLGLALPVLVLGDGCCSWCVGPWP
jgi:hypothetical protein